MRLLSVGTVPALGKHYGNQEGKHKAAQVSHAPALSPLCYGSDALIIWAVHLSHFVFSPASMAIMNGKTLHLMKGISGLMGAELLLYL